MGRLFNRLALAAVVSLAVLAGVTAAAVAQTSVTARAALHEGFGRVVFDWPVATEYQIERDGRRLRVIFNQPLTTSFDVVRRVLDGYLGHIRVAEDGRTVEFELAADLEFRAFAYGDKVIVDLMDPEPGAPARTADAELAALTTPETETALQASDSHTGDKPESPRDRVGVRVGADVTELSIRAG